MMPALLVALFLLAGTSNLYAQGAPFDMTPERPRQEKDEAAPVEPRPSLPTSPPETVPPRPPGPDDALSLPEKGKEPPAANKRTHRRYILPERKMALTGEIARRGWAIYLTQEEAASDASLHIGFQNAVVVAPENSRLHVTLNGAQVLDVPVQSPDSVGERTVALPAGTLRPGRNDVTIRAEQRHRTDCTVESTYELWSEIDGATTYLSFASADAGRFRRLEDIRALNRRPDGKALIRIVAPALERSDISADIIHLAKAIALSAKIPNFEFAVDSQLPPDAADAELTVFLGSFQDLAEATSGLPDAAKEGPVAAFAEVAGTEGPTLIVSGRNREDWLAAIASIPTAVDRPAQSRRDVLVTESWRTPNAPFLYGQTRIPFSELGFRSEQFAGRRFRIEFQFAIPSDFFASSYGEALLLLDAAYSDAVLPGSLINISVNGSIAASVPFSRRRGDLMEHFPIKVTMRHFRPGLNTMVLEASLRTQADAACDPGTTSGTTPRFALFQTSELSMPNFARIGQRPNLAATGGTGYPFSRETEPTAVVLNGGDAQTRSAAATLFARLALAAGRIIPVEVTSSPDAVRARNAIFLGAVNDMPEAVLAQVGIAEESRTSWAAIPVNGGSPVSSAGEVTPEEWRDQLQGSWIRRMARRFQQWASETFDITLETLRFAPDPDQAFLPPENVSLVVAQQTNPAANGVWTVMAAPDRAALQEGVGTFASHENWRRLSGHLTTFDLDSGKVETQPVNAFRFVQTQPPSLGNYRLIAANWLSANILSYALLLVLLCTLLGIVTSALLSRLGRRS